MTANQWTEKNSRKRCGKNPTWKCHERIPLNSAILDFNMASSDAHGLVLVDNNVRIIMDDGDDDDENLNFKVDFSVIYLI